jgi:glycosyltransferase involved in cell wall biosynthesis
MFIAWDDKEGEYMRIGFDARMASHPGIGRYIKSLIPEMVKQSPEDEFVLYGEAETLEGLVPRESAKVVKWDAPIYSLQEQVFVPSAAGEVDVLHVPHFNIPLGYKGKMVVTIHDLIYLMFPESVPSPLARRYASFMIKQALKRADKVIAVSAHTRDDITRLFGRECEPKIEVVYEAGGRDFHRIEDKTRIADVRSRYRLDDNIILYVGSVKPHKNVGTLLKVFELLRTWDVPHQLVICGRWDSKEDDLKGSVKGRYIRYLGEVPSKDLAVLYSMADALVHLSLYEGFGLTVLEAMQCGTPVVCSDRSSLPEVAGDAAFMVSPDDVRKTADILYNVIMSKELREGLIERGIERARSFSWARAARETLDIYHSVADN